MALNMVPYASKRSCLSEMLELQRSLLNLSRFLITLKHNSETDEDNDFNDGISLSTPKDQATDCYITDLTAAVCNVVGHILSEMINPNLSSFRKAGLDLSSYEIFKRGINQDLDLSHSLTWSTLTLELTDEALCESTPMEKKLEKSNLLIKKHIPEPLPNSFLNMTTLKQLKESLLHLEGVPVPEEDVLIALGFALEALCLHCNVKKSDMEKTDIYSVWIKGLGVLAEKLTMIRMQEVVTFESEGTVA